ncbi:MAG: GDSL-type esterase/lipase family protein [Acidaminococcaceae bacterium]|nr:GDSL-type esterase/lipase family protein [Acidaminococcaceae bacterium]
MEKKSCRNKFLLSLSLCFSIFVLATGFAPKHLNIISDCIASNVQLQASKAVPTSHFTKQNPASLKPWLTWTKVKGAVVYELELSTTLPKNPESVTKDSNCFYSTKQIYVNGFNADLSQNLTGNHFYWRVRGLDIEGNPISDFSDAEKVYVDPKEDVIAKPIPTAIFNQGPGSILLYPVYDWIPISGAAKFEVEILDALPENPNGIAPSIHRIDSAIVTGSEYYDEKPRVSDEPFYWRVRGLDNDGNPVGVYSDAGELTVSTTPRISVATFGDSITHGGGGISYSPSNWEYDYQHYLDFPTINLGRSGDTSQTMVDRFEQDVLPFHPRYLIIMGGTNSLRGGVPAAEVIANLQTLKEKCLENHIRPVFLTLPPINPANIKRAFNESTVSDWQEQIQLVNEFILTQVYIDITRDMSCPNGILPEKLAVDGLHLDIDGKKIMADAINADWPRIERIPWHKWLD